jgi:hypothetical protein
MTRSKQSARMTCGKAAKPCSAKAKTLSPSQYQASIEIELSADLAELVAVQDELLQATLKFNQMCADYFLTWGSCWQTDFDAYCETLPEDAIVSVLPVE